MALAITTSFDDSVENDVILEQIDGQTPPVETTLKNAENVYKSFLYLRKMYSMYPSRETILSMSTVSLGDYSSVDVPEGANYIIVNNYSQDNAGIKINGGEYIILAETKETFPVIAPDPSSSPIVEGDTIELKGTVSYIFKNIQEY